MAAYPYLEREDIDQSLAYAAWRLEERELPLSNSSALKWAPVTVKFVVDIDLSLEEDIPQWEQVSGPDDCRYLPLSPK